MFEYNFCRIIKNKVNILAIDCSPSKLFSLRMAFRSKKNYNLITERNYLVAFNLLSSYSDSIKIVILNLVAEEREAIELLARVRASNNLKNIPIIIQSLVKNEDNNRLNCLTYLQKSFEGKKIFKLVKFILNKSNCSKFVI